MQILQIEISHRLCFRQNIISEIKLFIIIHRRLTVDNNLL
jgi:hypothetical protein